jgi:hypothetical protein
VSFPPLWHQHLILRPVACAGTSRAAPWVAHRQGAAARAPGWPPASLPPESLQPAPGAQAAGPSQHGATRRESSLLAQRAQLAAPAAQHSKEIPGARKLLAQGRQPDLTRSQHSASAGRELLVQGTQFDVARIQHYSDHIGQCTPSVTCDPQWAREAGAVVAIYAINQAQGAMGLCTGVPCIRDWRQAAH